MIEHFERQPVLTRPTVWVMPPIRENWMTKMLGLFKDKRYCFGKIPAVENITRPEGTDD